MGKPLPLGTEGYTRGSFLTIIHVQLQDPASQLQPKLSNILPLFLMEAHTILVTVDG